MPAVTALRELSGGGIAVELDGRPWRTLPADTVVRAGLLVGIELDRPAARRVRGELRLSEALKLATEALSRRELAQGEVLQRLERRGVRRAVAGQAVAMLEQGGLLDEVGLAERRAEVLASRGHGDESIRRELGARGIPPAAIAGALERLPPERDRAREIVAARGGSPSTARFLTRKGFSEGAIESALPELVAD